MQKTKKNLQKGKQQLKLYNLDEDILELNDIAEKYPEIVSKLEEFLIEARTNPQLDRFKINGLGD